MRLVVLSPVMLLLEAQHLPNLTVAQRRLPLAHLPRNWSVGTVLLEELPSRERRGDGVVGRVEHLESQPILLHTQIADLTEVSRVNVTPGIPLAHLGLVDVLGEVAFVLVRLDDVANAQGVDVGVETAGEASSYALAGELGDSVGVHGVDVGVFVERERRVVKVALAEADFIGGFAGRDYDLADAEFAGGFDDIVGGCHVASPQLVVGY
jgi:hypothetical protein